jgi:YihY family inner membrane protein
LRLADGFSHARASAFAFALLLIEGVITVVGLAVASGSSAFSRTVIDVLEAVAPGPAGHLLTSAVHQAQDAGAKHQYLGLSLGLLACLITGSTALGQFERSCNRIYGVERDRPTLKKYGRALALTVTVGVVATAGVVMLVLGRPIAHAMSDSSLTTWNLLRWPLAVVLLVVATAGLLKWCPNRRQPGLSWLLYGAAVSVALTVLASLLLTAFFWWSTTFGETYGPLAGMIALMLWCAAVASGTLFGVAVAAELEYVRAGSRGSTDPRDSELPSLRQADADSMARP